MSAPRFAAMLPHSRAPNATQRDGSSADGSVSQVLSEPAAKLPNEVLRHCANAAHDLVFWQRVQEAEPGI